MEKCFYASEVLNCKEENLMTGVFTVRPSELSLNFLDVIKSMFKNNEEIEIRVSEKSKNEKNGLDIAIEEIENGEVETFDTFEELKNKICG